MPGPVRRGMPTDRPSRAPPTAGARQCAAVCTAMLGALAACVHADAFVRADRALFDVLHGVGGAGMALVVRALDAVGYAWGVLPADAVLVGALAFARRTREALFATVALGGGLLLNAALKHVVGRPRPVLETLPTVLETTLSFPSGHAQATASLATVAVLLGRDLPRARPWTWALVVLAGATGVSRVVAGVHSPADVLAGWTLGVGWACAAWGWSCAKP